MDILCLHPRCINPKCPHFLQNLSANWVCRFTSFLMSACPSSWVICCGLRDLEPVQPWLTGSSGHGDDGLEDRRYGFCSNYLDSLGYLVVFHFWSLIISDPLPLKVVYIWSISDPLWSNIQRPCEITPLLKCLVTKCLRHCNLPPYESCIG